MAIITKIYNEKSNYGLKHIVSTVSPRSAGSTHRLAKLAYIIMSIQFYVTRPFNYKSFTTLLRQLCNYHNVNFRIDKHYNHSKLTIRYFIEKDKTEE